MSHISDYVAQRRLDLQIQSQSLNERKFAIEQANFERKLQADFENEQRRNEANIQIAKIQAQNNLEVMAVQSILNGLNETQKFFQKIIALFVFLLPVSFVEFPILHSV